MHQSIPRYFANTIGVTCAAIPTRIKRLGYPTSSYAYLEGGITIDSVIHAPANTERAYNASSRCARQKIVDVASFCPVGNPGLDATIPPTIDALGTPGTEPEPDK